MRELKKWGIGAKSITSYLIVIDTHAISNSFILKFQKHFKWNI